MLKYRGMLFCAHGSRGTSSARQDAICEKHSKNIIMNLVYRQAERPLLPLLADGSEVLWLWGCGFAEGCAPDEYTHEVLTVRTEKTGEA